LGDTSASYVLYVILNTSVTPPRLVQFCVTLHYTAPQSLHKAECMGNHIKACN